LVVLLLDLGFYQVEQKEKILDPSIAWPDEVQEQPHGQERQEDEEHNMKRILHASSL
jgi:hypothetical protein